MAVALRAAVECAHTRTHAVVFWVTARHHLVYAQRDAAAPVGMSARMLRREARAQLCRVQGRVKVNNTIELPEQRQQRKVKSIQVFRQSVSSCQQVPLIFVRIAGPRSTCCSRAEPSACA